MCRNKAGVGRKWQRSWPIATPPRAWQPGGAFLMPVMGAPCSYVRAYVGIRACHAPSCAPRADAGRGLGYGQGQGQGHYSPCAPMRSYQLDCNWKLQYF